MAPPQVQLPSPQPPLELLLPAAAEEIALERRSTNSWMVNAGWAPIYVTLPSSGD